MERPFEVPQGLSLETEVSPADWVDERLLPFRGSGEGVLVGQIVPTGVDAYARILHPAMQRLDDGYEPLPWKRLARERGKRIHPEVQLKALLGEEFRDGPPWGELPEEGSLPDSLRGPLVAILRRFTLASDRCWFCIWDGFGFWGPPGALLLTMKTDLRGLLRRRSMRRAARRRARLQQAAFGGIPRVQIHPSPDRRGALRECFLFRGSFDAVLGLKFGGSSQSPNYWWPDNRDWVVVSELDAPSTYVGGSEPLVQAILASEMLEAVPSDPEHRFDWLGDRINAPDPS